MPWLSRNNFTPTDKLHSDDLNNLANDDRTWGGDVNGGGYTLSNVNIVQVNPQAAGQVTSVFGRIGDVKASAQDGYTAAMVGAVPIARQVNTGNVAITGLLGGGPLSTDLNLSAAVVSVFNRTGQIALTAPDITKAGGVLQNLQIKTPFGAGLQNGGPLTGDLSLAVMPDSSNQQIQVMSQGSPVGSPRHAINFVSGTGALVTVQEITASNRIDVTVQSTGTGGGMVDPTQVTGDLIVRGLTAPATRLPVGTDAQVLTADHLQPLGVKWAAPASTGAVTSVFGRVGAVVASAQDGYTAAMVLNAVDQTGSYTNPAWILSLPWSKIANPPAFMLDPTLAKGDMIVHGQAGTTRLIPGADGSILITDSSMAAGVKWGQIPVTSVFGRTGSPGFPGVIVAQGGDYTVAQVTGAVPNTTFINTPTTGTGLGEGLTGGGNLSGNLSLSVVPDTTTQRIEIWQEGVTKIGVRKALNFKSGAGVAITIADSPPVTGNNRIDITIASSGTGTGGGLVDPTTAKGDLIVKPAGGASVPPQALPVGADFQVLTADKGQPLGMRWMAPTGGAGSQSPWTGTIDAAGNDLNNVASIGVNIASDKTKARVYAFVNASEDGFRATTNAASGMAAASFINDIGDSVCIRSYGSGFVGPRPGIATLEATNSLALLANAAEVMRLHGGHVLIGTTTDDGLNALQVNGKVKSLTGGYVFPDGTTQVTAFTAAASAVTSVFGRTGAVVAKTSAPFDYSASNVTNAVDSSSTYNDPVWITSLAWSKIQGAPALLVDPTTAKGDLIARGATGPATRLAASTTNGWVLTADSTLPLGVKWAATVGGQTPWTSDINAAGFALNNTGTIHVQGGVNPASGVGLELSYQSPVSYIVSYDRIAGAYKDLSVSGASIEIQAEAGGPLKLNPIGGSVGIGTTSPQYPLHVVYNSTNPQFGIGVDGNAAYSLQLGYVFPNGRIQALNNGAGSILMLNPSGGNVGIGTTSPQALAHLVTSNTGSAPIEVLRIDAISNTGGNGGLITWANAAQPHLAGMLGFVRNGAGVRQDLCFHLTSNWTSTDPVEKIRFTGDGNVGIGTTSPGGALEVAGFQKWSIFGSNVNAVLPPNQSGVFLGWNFTGGAAEANFAWNGGGTGIIFADTTSSVWKERMRITGAGYIGVNNASPQCILDISGLTRIIGPLGVVPGSGAGVEIYYNSGGFVQAWNRTAGGVQPMTIYGSPVVLTGGRVGVSNGTPGYALDVAGDCNITGTYRVNGTPFTANVGVYINGVNQGSAPAIDFFAGAQMQISLGGGPAGTIRVTFTCTASDLQLKRDVQSLTGGLPLITQLRPITAKWNGLAGTREGQRVVSVIAQELQAVIPDAVSPYRAKLRPEDEEDVELLSVDSMAITAHLILAIQQLTQRLKTLEEKVN